MLNEIKIISGSANLQLAKKIAGSEKLGLSLVGVKTSRFSDGEINVQIEETIRGHDVFVIQSTCPPVNENLMELLLLIDALKRASARSITVVIPYFGYARQDAKEVGRTAIGAKLVADIITTTGANRVLTMDLHARQIQGFFDIPVDNLLATPIFASFFAKELEQNQDKTETVIVAPDIGATRRARRLARRLNLELVVVDKRRSRTEETTSVYNIIGEIEDKRAILFDDIVSSGSTLIKGANALKEQGAKEIWAGCSHGVFSGPAIRNIEKSVISKMVVTDTIPLPKEGRNSTKIEVVSSSKAFAEAIRRISNGESVSAMFKH